MFYSRHISWTDLPPSTSQRIRTVHSVEYRLPFIVWFFHQLGEQTDRAMAKLLGDVGFNLYRIQIGSTRANRWR